MDGMSMMFKALGIDPEVIMKSAADFKVAIDKVNNDLEIIKNQNAQILAYVSQVRVVQIGNEESSHA